MFKLFKNLVLTKPKQKTRAVTASEDSKFGRPSTSPPSLKAGILKSGVSSKFPTLLKGPDREVIHDTSVDQSTSASTRGLSAYRPEIISLLDFMPAYVYQNNSPTTSAINDLLNIQLNVRILGEEVVNDITKKFLDDAELAELINDKLVLFAGSMLDAEKLLDQLAKLLAATDGFEDRLNFRKYSVDNPVQHWGTFEDTMLSLGFNTNHQKKYTNTKILSQFIEDLYNKIVFYSPKTLTKSDITARKDDIDPFAIIKDKKIDIELSMRKGIGPYFSLLSILPKNNSSDRMYLTTSFLAREFDVSSELGAEDFNTIPEASNLNVTNAGNPFVKILGRPGDTALAATVGNTTNLKSLPVMSAIAYNSQDNNLVLPFEPTWIIDGDDGTAAPFIPGPIYMFDRLLSGAPQKTQSDLAQINDFQKRVDIRDNIKLLKRLIKYTELTRETSLAPSSTKDQSNKLKHCTQKQLLLDIFETFIAIETIDAYKPGQEFITLGSDYTETYRIISAILQVAKADSVLKPMLEQYFRPSFNAGGQIDGPLTGFEFWKLTQARKNTLNKMLDHMFGTPKQQPAPFDAAQDMWSRDRCYKALTDGILEGPSNQIVKLWRLFRNKLTSLDKDDALTGGAQATRFRNITHIEIWSLMYDTFVTMGEAVYSDISFIKENNAFVYKGFFPTNELVIIKDLLKSLDFRGHTKNNQDYSKRAKILYGTHHTGTGNKKTSQAEADLLALELGYITPVHVGILDKKELSGLKGAVYKIRSTIVQLLRENQSTAAMINTLSGYFNSVHSYISSFTLFFTRTGNFEFMQRWVNTVTAPSLLGPVDKFAQPVTQERLNSDFDLGIFNKQQIILARRNIDQLKSILTMFKTALPQAEVASPPTTRAPAAAGPPQPVEFPPYLDEALPLQKPEYKNTGVALVQTTDSLGTQSYIEGFKAALKTTEFIGTPYYKTEKKIMSIGIPAGMTSGLRQRLDMQAVSDYSERNKELDIVELKIYKQDLEYEDIQFLPLTFKFELSRFVEKVLHPDVLETIKDKSPGNITIEQLAEFMMTVNYGVNGLTSDYGKADWVNLTDKQRIEAQFGSDYDATLGKASENRNRQDIRANHVVSDFLATYIRLLLGLDMREKTFLRYNTNGYGIPDPDLTSAYDELIEAESSQVYSRLFSTKTIFTDGVDEYRRALTPKKYERVFNVMIDPEHNFPIDVKATQETKQGQNQLELLLANQMLTDSNDNVLTSLPGQLQPGPNGPPGPVKFSRVNKDNISLERYYVAVNTLVAVDQEA